MQAMYLLLILLVASCSPEKKTTNAKLRVSFEAVVGTRFDNGLMVWAKHRPTNRFLVKKLTQASAEVELENGIWDMAIIGWQGSSAGQGLMEGNMLCEVKTSIDLDGVEIDLDFNPTRTGCLHNAITGNTSDTNPYLLGGQLRKVRFMSCADFERSLENVLLFNDHAISCGETMPEDEQFLISSIENLGMGGYPAEDPQAVCSAKERGQAQSFKVTIYESNLSNDPYESASGGLESRCFSNKPLPSVTVEGLPEKYLDIADTDLRLPLGHFYDMSNTREPVKLPIKVEAFENSDCSGERIEYAFKSGLAGRDHLSSHHLNARGMIAPWSIENPEEATWSDEDEGFTNVMTGGEYLTVYLSNEDVMIEEEVLGSCDDQDQLGSGDSNSGSQLCQSEAVGDGTSIDNPIVICSAQDFLELTNDSGSLKYVVIGQDLELNGLTAGSIHLQNVKIYGNIEQGHTPVINGAGFQGPSLFNQITNATFEDLKFTNFQNIPQALLAPNGNNISMYHLEFQNIGTFSSINVNQGLLFGRLTYNDSSNHEIYDVSLFNESGYKLVNDYSSSSLGINLGIIAGYLDLSSNSSLQINDSTFESSLNVHSGGSFGGLFGKVFIQNVTSNYEALRVYASEVDLMVEDINSSNSFSHMGGMVGVVDTPDTGVSFSASIEVDNSHFTLVFVNSLSGDQSNLAGVIGRLDSNLEADFQLSSTDIDLNHSSSFQVNPFIKDLVGSFMSFNLLSRANLAGSASADFSRFVSSTTDIMVSCVSGSGCASVEVLGGTGSYLAYLDLFPHGNTDILSELQVGSIVRPIVINNTSHWNSVQQQNINFSNSRLLSYVITSDLTFSGSFTPWDSYSGHLTNRCENEDGTLRSCIISGINYNAYGNSGSIGVIKSLTSAKIGDRQFPLKFSNVSIESAAAQNLGLFGIANDSFISVDLDSLELTHTGFNNNIGGVLGYSENNNQIYNSRIGNLNIKTGTLSEKTFSGVGGIIGKASNQVELNNNTLENIDFPWKKVNYFGVTSATAMGGLIGYYYSYCNADCELILERNRIDNVVSITQDYTSSYNSSNFGALIGEANITIESGIEHPSVIISDNDVDMSNFFNSQATNFNYLDVFKLGPLNFFDQSVSGGYNVLTIGDDFSGSNNVINGNPTL